MHPTTDFTAKFFHDHKLRMSACYWLATFPYSSAPDELCESLEMMEEAEICQLFQAASEAIKEECFQEFGGEPAPADILLTVQTLGCLGFVVQIDSPTEPDSDWYSYNVIWGYGETLKDAIKSALHKVDDLRARRWDSSEPVAVLYDAA